MCAVPDPVAPVTFAWHLALVVAGSPVISDFPRSAMVRATPAGRRRACSTVTRIRFFGLKKAKKRDLV